MGIRICLDEVLKKKRMTSKELCRQVGITEANLSVLRSGKAKGIRLHTMNRICYFPVSYTHLTLPTRGSKCRSRWSPYH